MELYLVRHGQTQANLDGVYCGSSDLDLTALGEQQADAVAAQLAGISFDAVYTSGLQRTHQTAQRILGADAEFVQLTGLDEMAFGEWELRHHKELQQEDAEHYAAWCADWQRTVPPGGEGFRDFSARVRLALSDLQQEHAGQRVLIVAHQGVISIICTQLLKLEDRAMWHFRIEQGAHSRIDYRDGFSVIHCLNNRGTALT